MVHPGFRLIARHIASNNGHPDSEWDWFKNAADKYRLIGRKLGNFIVRETRVLGRPFTARVIAERYGIKRAHVRAICRGEGGVGQPSPRPGAASAAKRARTPAYRHPGRHRFFMAGKLSNRMWRCGTDPAARFPFKTTF